MNSSLVYLVQADTTVGFLSSDDKRLSRVKQRPISKKTLQVVDSLETLKKNTRIPNKFKNRIRRSKKTTFIYPNGLSFRLIDKSDPHHKFIKKFGAMYSSSANLTKASYEEEFAKKSCEVEVIDKRGFFESTPSRIIKINNIKTKKIR